jgi:rare lipoprotein A
MRIRGWLRPVGDRQSHESVLTGWRKAPPPGDGTVGGPGAGYPAAGQKGGTSAGPAYRCRVLAFGLALGVIGAAAEAAARCAPTEALPPDAVVASWYGRWHQGRPTASGARFDRWQLTAAHPTLALGTRLTIVNLANQRRIEVLVNDRGPGLGRGIDLSEAAALALGMRDCGLTPVSIAVLREADLRDSATIRPEAGAVGLHRRSVAATLPRQGGSCGRSPQCGFKR